MSSREDIDASIEIPSLMHPGQDSPVIRSHRAPKHRRGHLVLAGTLALVMGAESVLAIDAVSRETPTWHAGVVAAPVSDLATELIERTANTQISRSCR